MSERMGKSFVLWGGYIVASVVLDIAGFYFSAVIGTVLFGVCLVGAFMLALGRNVESLDKLEAEYPTVARGLALMGKADVLFSILLLPWIIRAFVISMGGQWNWFDETYAKAVVYIMAFAWGAMLALAVGQFVLKRTLGR